MKENLKLTFAMLGVTVTVAVILIYLWGRVQVYAPTWVDIPRRDPIYQTNLAGDSPQIVHQVKVGDDVVPLIYQTWYNPKTKEYTDFIVEVE